MGCREMFGWGDEKRINFISYYIMANLKSSLVIKIMTLWSGLFCLYVRIILYILLG